MKKLMLIALLITSAGLSVSYAQSSNSSRHAERKAQRDAERAQMKAQEAAENAVSYEDAVQALNNRKFVLEADQVIFRNGQSAFVTSNTNFVWVNEEKGTVQVAFNTAYPGPNGIGGITVDGSVSDFKATTDKRGNINCQFSIQGIGISAQVFLSLTNGGNKASVDINPNFNGNTMTLSGKLLPLKQSSIYKGRAW